MSEVRASFTSIPWLLSNFAGVEGWKGILIGSRRAAAGGTTAHHVMQFTCINWPTDFAVFCRASTARVCRLLRSVAPAPADLCAERGAVGRRRRRDREPRSKSRSAAARSPLCDSLPTLRRSPWPRKNPYSLLPPPGPVPAAASRWCATSTSCQHGIACAELRRKPPSPAALPAARTLRPQTQNAKGPRPALRRACSTKRCSRRFAPHLRCDLFCRPMVSHPFGGTGRSRPVRFIYSRYSSPNCCNIIFSSP
jgi:hypothetical protein